MRRLRNPSGAEIVLRWDRDTRVTARRGDSVTTALLGAGIVATSRSLKFRRPRGPYCLRGDCGTCLVRIDGLPNLRACMVPVAEGMEVSPQNRMVDAGPDPTALADKVLGPGMDHHHFMVRPRFANQIMQGVARNLAGLGLFPDRAPDRPGEVVRLRPGVLIVGAGPAGRAAAEMLHAAGRDVYLVDRDGPPAGELALPAAWRTGVFAAYAAEGVFAAAHRPLTGATRLYTFEPEHVVIATGARDPMVPVPGNDIPGVMAARGLVRLLASTETGLVEPAVVVGSGPAAEACARALRTEAIAPDAVETVLGRNRVEGIRLRDRKVECGVVAMAASPAPAYELARQAGATVRWNGAGFAVQRDEAGRCRTDGPWTLWAAGDVCGFMGPDAAADDGRRVARSILGAAASGKARRRS